jgi:MFS-type transporter involved in bile tolerance (Atg22 family)
MNIFKNKVLGAWSEQWSSFESALARKENVFSFLIIRFVLMSGMVIAFSWTFLHLSP